MPSTFSALDHNLPRFTGGESLEKRVAMLQDYQYQLLEQLRYTLSNLGTENFNDTELDKITEPVREELDKVADALVKEIADSNGNIARLELTAEGLTSRISNAEGDVSSLQQTANSLTSRISNAEGDVSSLQQTANSLTSRISNAEGDVSALEQTANSLTSRISNAEGDVSSLQQTASSLTSRISNAEGDVSALEQTAKGLTSSVSDAEKNISTLQQTASKIEQTVSGKVNGEYVSSSIQTALKGVKLSVSNGTTSSTLTLKAGETQLSSQEIKMTGLVTLTGLSGGTTSIDGACIKTGTIDAKRLNLNGYATVTGLSGGTTTIDGACIKTGTIDAKRLNLNGYATVTGLSGGTTTIDGACIQTGTIDAKRLNLEGAIAFEDFDEDTQEIISGIATDAEDAKEIVDAWSYVYGGETYIDGGMLMTGTVMASNLLGGYVGLLDYRQREVGGIKISYTETGYGLEMSTEYGGIRMHPAGNWWVDALYGSMGITRSGIVCSVSPVPESSGISLGTYGFPWSDVYTEYGKFSDLVEDVSDLAEELSDLKSRVTALERANG